MTAPLFVGPGMVTRTIRVSREDVAWVRYVIEAHDGLANVHVQKGGVVTLVTTEEQAETLDGVLQDVEVDVALDRLDLRPG